MDSCVQGIGMTAPITSPRHIQSIPDRFPGLKRLRLWIHKFGSVDNLKRIATTLGRLAPLEQVEIWGLTAEDEVEASAYAALAPAITRTTGSVILSDCSLGTRHLGQLLIGPDSSGPPAYRSLSLRGCGAERPGLVSTWTRMVRPPLSCLLSFDLPCSCWNRMACSSAGWNASSRLSSAALASGPRRRTLQRDLVSSRASMYR